MADNQSGPKSYKKQQGKPSWTGSGITLQIGGHSFHCSSVSVFSGNLHNLEVMDERMQMGKQEKGRHSPELFIFLGCPVIVKSFWSQQASFEKIQHYILDRDGESDQSKKINK